MESIPIPELNKFTIYSKSGCPNCIKVKKLLQDKQIHFIIVDCDEFILEDKMYFLKFMEKIIGIEYKTFPMVFDNGKFVGGYADTMEHTEHTLNFNEEF